MPKICDFKKDTQIAHPKVYTLDKKQKRTV